jgi:hypothetical protein
LTVSIVISEAATAERSPAEIAAAKSQGLIFSTGRVAG